MRSFIVLPIAILSLACVVSQCGCAPMGSSGGKFDPGVIENSTYTNPTLKFRISWPEDWVVADEQTRAQAADAGMDLITNNDARKRRELNAAEIRDMNLLLVGKYVLGDPRPNPNLVIAVENLQGRQMNIDQYVEASKQALKQLQIPLTIEGDPYKETIGQTEFMVLNTRLMVQGQNIQQRMYIMLREGFGVNCAITYFSDEELKELEAIMQSFEEYTPPAIPEPQEAGDASE